MDPRGGGFTNLLNRSHSHSPARLGSWVFGSPQTRIAEQTKSRDVLRTPYPRTIIVDSVVCHLHYDDSVQVTEFLSRIIRLLITSKVLCSLGPKVPWRTRRTKFYARRIPR